MTPVLFGIEIPFWLLPVPPLASAVLATLGVCGCLYALYVLLVRKEE